MAASVLHNSHLNVNSLLNHSSEIRDLCPSKILQNLPYFWNMKTYAKKKYTAQNEKRKNLRGFSYSKNMASVSLGHFIKHKPLISEECHAMT